MTVRPARAPDWADTVHGPLRVPEAPARDLLHTALSRPPAWLAAAMVVRNALVAPFGLQRGVEGKGHFLERLPVVADTPDHFEAGLVDRHLTFTLAVRRHSGEVFVTTSIWFNRWLGRVYLAAIMPGHILATRQIAERIAGPLRRVRGNPLTGDAA